MDRVPHYECVGCRFDSCHPHHEDVSKLASFFVGIHRFLMYNIYSKIKEELFMDKKKKGFGLKERIIFSLGVVLMMFMASIPWYIIMFLVCVRWGYKSMTILARQFEKTAKSNVIEDFFYYIIKGAVAMLIGPFSTIYFLVKDVKKAKMDKIYQIPFVREMAEGKEIFWINPKSDKNRKLKFKISDIDDAEARLARFAPYIMAAFPETEVTEGIIESPLTEAPGLKAYLEKDAGVKIPGKLFVKRDSDLAVSGSIKARGGIYEVLKFAEEVAIKEGMLSLEDDYSILTEDRFKELFSKYSVAVGSTGNLGLSIGIISAKLGFKVTVHMSADARQWKKDLLRSKGVTVVEYPDDYQKAVAEGRKEASTDSTCHFVDDEGSQDLFLGYSVAAKRIVKQFEELNIKCDEEHPVFVYIPCGVGGAPGGVTFGLKTLFGKNIHVLFAEPTMAPCMTLGLITGLNDKICVSDIGLDGKTEADGLAVGRASYLVGDVMTTLLDGCYTIEDEKLFPYLAALKDLDGLFIEPSSCASFPGPAHVVSAREYLEAKGLADKMENATHILWATGGSMVPKEEAKTYYERGKKND